MEHLLYTTDRFIISKYGAPGRFEIKQSLDLLKEFLQNTDSKKKPKVILFVDGANCGFRNLEHLYLKKFFSKYLVVFIRRRKNILIDRFIHMTFQNSIFSFFVPDDILLLRIAMEFGRSSRIISNDKFRDWKWNICGNSRMLKNVWNLWLNGIIFKHNGKGILFPYDIPRNVLKLKISMDRVLDRVKTENIISRNVVTEMFHKRNKKTGRQEYDEAYEKLNKIVQSSGVKKVVLFDGRMKFDLKHPIWKEIRNTFCVVFFFHRTNRRNRSIMFKNVIKIQNDILLLRLALNFLNTTKIISDRNFYNLRHDICNGSFEVGQIFDEWFKTVFKQLVRIDQTKIH